MFQVVEKMLDTLTNESKFCTKSQVSKPKKLQRSPKIMGYYREDDDDEEASNAGMFKEVTLPCSFTPEQVHGKNDCNKVNSNGNNVRVKVLLTKQEAAELLAKYASEANLGAMDVVNELAKLPSQRISVVSVSSFDSSTSTLSTIPEEDEYEDEDEDEDEEEEQEFLIKC